MTQTQTNDAITTASEQIQQQQQQQQQQLEQTMAMDATIDGKRPRDTPTGTPNTRITKAAHLLTSPPTILNTAANTDIIELTEKSTIEESKAKKDEEKDKEKEDPKDVEKGDRDKKK